MKGIDEILALKEGPERTAALASWVQGLFDEDEARVLVGAAAQRLAEALERWRDRDPKKEKLVEWAQTIPSE